MAQEIGLVKIVTGTVTAIAADGSKRILQVGDRVYPTDLLTTADGSTVMIQLVNGSLVDMGSNDSMQLGAALAEQDMPVSTAQNPQPAGLSVEEIQAALLAGADPTAIAEATAAGNPAAGGGVQGNEGHVPVTVAYLNPVAPVTNGFDTTGPNVAFTPIVPEVLILNPQPAGGVGGNQAPIARDDISLGNAPSTPVTINVVGNDNDPDGTLNLARLQIVGTATPGQPLVIAGQGIWTVDTRIGTITFTPAEGFTGNPAPISYTVTDNEGLQSNPATVTIGYNQPPVAANDSSSGNVPGSAVTINVLGNDNDPDGALNPATVQIAGTSGPGQPLSVSGEGTWSINTSSGEITFTPFPGFEGNPTPISYTVADNLGLLSNQAAVSIGYIPTFIATNAVVDESEALPSQTGTLRINGQIPASVELTAADAMWNSATQTLIANDNSYQITVSNDTYTFTLLKPLAHPNSGAAESMPIEFTFSAQLTGSDGSVVNTTFTTSVFDDGPTVVNSNGQIQNTTDPAQTLSGLIDYDLGFDGFGATGGVTLSNNNSGLTSRADSLSYLILDTNGDQLQELYAFVDKGVATTDFAGLAGDRMVFSLLPTVDDATDGAYKLVLHDVLDMPAPVVTILSFDNASMGAAGQISVGNSLVVEGSNLVLSQNHIGVNDSALNRGESLTFKFGALVNAVQLNEINVDQAGPDRFSWTAYKDGNMVASRSNVIAPVNGGYTSAINVNGGYDTLKIDVTAGKFEIGGLKFQGSSPQSLPLNFGFTATDGDGDSVSGVFSVDTGALLATNITTVLPELQHADSLIH